MGTFLSAKIKKHNKIEISKFKSDIITHQFMLIIQLIHHDNIIYNLIFN